MRRLRHTKTEAPDGPKACGSLVAAALLVTTPPIFAGGWAVITMDSLPERIRAGEPFTLGYAVR
ncbi:MAG TPA: hypothetical protein VHJ77_06875 [Vicinamibacterales bacterium]|nr:hypothetical protein [Vicinamibacterales bacterium]